MSAVVQLKYLIPTASMSAARTLLYWLMPTTEQGRLAEAHVTNQSNAVSCQFSCYVRPITAIGTPTTDGPADKDELHTHYDSQIVTARGFVTASEPTYIASPSDEWGHDGAPSVLGWHFVPGSEKLMPTLYHSTYYGLYMDVPPTAQPFDAIARVVIQMA